MAGCTAFAGALPLLAQSKPASGPVARYDMRAGTVTGAGAMGRGAGSAMGMMFGGGGGGGPQHELYLRLGSSQPPAKGGPKADHFMPPVAKLGKSVPLLTPQSEKEPRDELPQMGNEKPRGRILIYWGCAEHAPKGQPVIIDLAKISSGQVPPGMWSGTIVRDWGPMLSNSKTFGRWPNDDAMGGNKAIKADASLIGAHRVAGNYSPEMAFNLTKDFMAGLNVRTSTLPSGASMLRWNALPDATGFYAYLFGGKSGPNGEMGDMVMWSSSATRQFGGGFEDWLSPAQVSPLVANKTLLPPSATSCIVPAEVRNATEFRMGTLTGYGPEESFSYPPRPADPKAAWNLQWTARIRHRSTTSWMDMPGMPGGMGDMSSGQTQPQQRPECRPRGGLGGIMGGVLGGRPGC
ncbi:hypothetical protein C0V78_03215 [Novosphingobium sp. TH158]|nr:hypothetical protein C0V78_03215 [Novosphingobium sp. TH158]